MDTLAWVGILFTVGGVVAYVAGVVAAYPGRAFSLTAVMIGVTMLAVGRSAGEETKA